MTRPTRTGEDAKPRSAPSRIRQSRPSPFGVTWRCTKCDTWKVADEFRPLSNPYSKCGLMSWCRACEGAHELTRYHEKRAKYVLRRDAARARDAAWRVRVGVKAGAA